MDGATECCKAGCSWRSKLRKLPKERQPGFVPPQLALMAATPPPKKGWLHELKLDGYRMQARKDGTEVQLLTRTGLDWTHRVRSVANEVARLAVEKATLDGEVVVVAPNGTTNFADLQASMQEGAKHVLTYFCFDLLHVDGQKCARSAAAGAEGIAGDVLRAPMRMLRVSEHIETGGAELLHKACELQAEGIVSKRAAGKYSPGRSGDWLKMKCLHEQEFVVGGYTLPSNGIRGVGALLLGLLQGWRADLCGADGTGIYAEDAQTLARQAGGAGAEDSSLCSCSGGCASAGLMWVKPEMVAQVRFATWTADELVRQAAFLGVA